MGLFSMAFAGGSLILIGSWESLSSHTTPQPHRFSTITLLSTFSLSLLFISDSLLSLFSSLSPSDPLGPTLQLPILSVSTLFLLFSILGLLTNLSKSNSLTFPYPLINLTLFFAFAEEFLLFYIKLKDQDGIENRYYDLMLVPVSICLFSTLIELNGSKFGSFPKLGRGVGLVLQGSWFVQMGFSFYSDLIANNCDLHRISRGNFTVQCKSHMDRHRGGAIAVLLFNCHLAMLVAVVCGVYAVVGKRFVGEGERSGRSYRPIGGEVVGVVGSEGKFTLDSDSDEGNGGEIKDEGGGRRGNGSVELVGNGFGSH